MKRFPTFLSPLSFLMAVVVLVACGNDLSETDKQNVSDPNSNIDRPEIFTLESYQRQFGQALNQQSSARMEELIRKADLKFPEERQVAKDKAVLISVQGNLKQALVAYKEALNQPTVLPEGRARRLNATIHNNMGNLYLNLKKLGKAKKHLHQAIEFEPKFAPAYYSLGSLYLEKKKYAKAREHFEKAFSLNMAPATPFDYFDMIFLLQEKEEQADALRLLLEGKKRFPTSVGFHANLAIVYDRMDQHNLAYYHLLVENLIMNPNNPYLNIVAEKLPQIGQKALNDKDKSYRDLFYFLRGINALHKNKFLNSEKYYRQALNQNPEFDVIIKLYLAEVLAIQNNFEESRQISKSVSCLI